MSKSRKEELQSVEPKVELGKLIKKERQQKELSQRELARLCTSKSGSSLPNSNLKYIEDGVNAPSPEIFEQISKHLDLLPEKQLELDKLYSEVRQAPPPDICRIMLKNQELNKSLRLVAAKKLTSDDFEIIEKCFESIANNKGDNSHETV